MKRSLLYPASKISIGIKMKSSSSSVIFWAARIECPTKLFFGIKVIAIPRARISDE